MFRLHITVS